jgi:hypothetical protein
MSTAEKVKKQPAREYTYEVSKDTAASVRRVFGAGASDVLKKLEKGKRISKGPHTFKAKKIRVLPEGQESSATEEKEGAPDGAPSTSPQSESGKGPDNSKGGKDNR